MPQELVVRILGDASSLERAFKKSTVSSKKFDREIGRTFRGVVAGSGAFRGLGRSIAFASGAFLGGAGLTAVVRSAFEEMSNAQKVAAQTNAAIKSTGAVAGVTAAHVEELGLKLLDLSGVDDEVIKSSENLLLTFTNIRNVGRLKQDQVFDRTALLSLDIATRKQQDLSSVSLALGKALQDPVKGLTALRRVGLTFTAQQEKVIKSLVASGKLMQAQEKILDILETKYKGSAAAAGGTLAGKLAILKENIQNVEGAIATLLLPAITKLVDQLVKWVQNTDNQKRVLDDVKQAMAAVSDVAKVLKGAFDGLNTVTGSTKHTIELLVGAFVAFKALKLVSYLSGVATQMGRLAANSKKVTGALPGTVGGPAGPPAPPSGGTAAKIARNIGKVGAILAISFAGAKLLQKAIGQAPQLISPQSLRLGVQSPIGADPFGRARQPPGPVRPPVGALGPITAADVRALAKSIAKAPGVKTALTRAQSNQLFDDTIGRLIDRVQDAPIRGQVRKLQNIAVLIQSRIDATKGVARKLALEDKLREVTRQAGAARQAIMQAFLDRLQFNVDKAGATKTIIDDIAALQKLNAALAKRIKAGGDTLALEQQQFQVQQQIADVLKQQAEARKAARDARQFKLLGFGPTGEELVPGVKSLRKQLASVTDIISGTFLDTGKTDSVLKNIRKVLADGLHSVSAEVRSKIQSILADLKAQLKKASVDVTRFNKTARGQFVLAGASPGGTGTVTIQGGIHLHGVQNVQQMEEALAKRRKQRAHARRGTR